MLDPWTLGYRAGLKGAAYSDNPLEGEPGATAWAFGCGEGRKERNRRAFSVVLARCSA